jgi:hypothetical protein
VLAAVLAIGTAAAATPIAEGSSALCGSRASSRSAGYRHVVVVMAENKSYADIIGPRGSVARRHAPFLNHLAKACRLATNYRGITHPSHPNYMAITGGRPAIASSNGPNVFRQVRRSGETWRSYNPSMPHPCHRSAAYPYKPGHNPGIAWRRVSEDCRRWDVNGHALAADVAHHAMPAYAFIAPTNATICTPPATPTKAPYAPAMTGSETGSGASPTFPATPPDVLLSSSPGTKAQADKAPTNAANTASRPSTAATKPATSPPSHVATFVLSAHVRPGTRSRLLQPLLAPPHHRTTPGIPPLHRPRRRPPHHRHAPSLRPPDSRCPTGQTDHVLSRSPQLLAPGREPRSRRRPPHTITVTLNEDADALTGEIQDDGCGFDVVDARTRPEASLHLGLDSLTERVRAAGGKVDIDSAPGHGTRLLLTIPTTHAASAAASSP